MKSYPFCMVSFTKQTSIQRWFYSTSLSMIILIFALTFYSIKEYFYIKKLKDRYKKKEPIAHKLVELKETIKEYEHKIKIAHDEKLNTSIDKKKLITFINFLKALSEVIPDNVTIETIKVKDNFCILVSGLSYSIDDINLLINRLTKHNPSLTIILNSIKKLDTSKPKKSLLHFNLIAHNS